MDFKNIDNETLWKMFDEVVSNYYKEATKTCGDGNKFLNSLEAKNLDELTKRYEEIGDELRKRLGIL